MKNIQLKKLELTNYRNIEHAIYEFEGNSKIVGENRIGKTNTLESIYFLLSDCLLGGINDVSAIKPLKDTKLVVRVEGTFDIDGQEFSIAKEYGENWVKERGTANLVFKGHYCNYYINGLKQGTLKAFKQTINEAFGITEDATVKIDFYKMLIDPFYLGDMGDSGDWTNLRAFIIKLVGDVEDEDVFSKEPRTSVLKENINSAFGKLDVVKKKLKSDIDSWNEKLIQDDAKIEMLEKTENPTDIEVETASKGIEECQDNINSLKGQNSVTSAATQIKEQISSITARINQQKELELKNFKNNPISVKNKQINEQLQVLYNKGASLTEMLTDVKNKMSYANYTIEKNNKEISSLMEQREKLVIEYRTIKSDIANSKDHVSTECPVCHQPLPEEQVASAIASCEAKLNSDLAKVNEKGKKIKERVESLKVENDKLESNLKSLNDELLDIENQIESNREQIKCLSSQLISEDNSQEIVYSNVVTDLEKERDDLKEELSRILNEESNQTTLINQKIYEEKQRMSEFQKVIDNRNYYNRQMLEKEKIEKEKEQHSRLLIEAEQKRELLNLFIFTKLKMLDENVSKVFGNIKFQLIKENINGGFDAVCKPYIYKVDSETSTSVLWKSGSKSERVITGIAIVEAIKNRLNLPNLPQTVYDFLLKNLKEMKNDIDKK